VKKCERTRIGKNKIWNEENSKSFDLDQQRRIIREYSSRQHVVRQQQHQQQPPQYQHPLAHLFRNRVQAPESDEDDELNR